MCILLHTEYRLAQPCSIITLHCLPKKKSCSGAGVAVIKTVVPYICCPVLLVPVCNSAGAGGLKSEAWYGADKYNN